jgi:diguanylate cyclase (GGDEF)-like protein
MSPDGSTVLVVDDPIGVELLAGILGEGFELMAASTAEEALGILAATVPDAILIDAAGPGFDGYALCRAIKENHRLAEIPVLLLVGANSREAEARGLDYGAADCLAKPPIPATVRLRLGHHIALNRARSELQRAATTDPLTGLVNRRRFDEVLQLEWRRLGRSGAPLSLLLIELDRFKASDDEPGQVAGASCVQRAATVIRRAVGRAADLAARYGDMEFGCVLPETDAAGAAVIAERVRAGIEALAIAHEGSEVAPVVTASIGVATGPCRRDQMPQLLLGLADSQLYAAKLAGGNRICSLTAD